MQDAAIRMVRPADAFCADGPATAPFPPLRKPAVRRRTPFIAPLRPEKIFPVRYDGEMQKLKTAFENAAPSIFLIRGVVIRPTTIAFILRGAVTVVVAFASAERPPFSIVAASRRRPISAVQPIFSTLNSCNKRSRSSIV